MEETNDIEWVCWDCATAAGSYKVPSSPDGECYCFPCLWDLVANNSTATNPFN